MLEIKVLRSVIEDLSPEAFIRVLLQYRFSEVRSSPHATVLKGSEKIDAVILRPICNGKNQMETIKFVEKMHYLNDAYFIFSSLPTSSRIRILRMQDPERGQTKLNFHTRNEEEEDH